MFEYEWGNPDDNYSDPSNTLRHPADDPYSASHIDLPAFHSVFDPRSFPGASYPLAPPSFLSSSDFFTLPKPEPPGPVLTNSGSANLDRIGLNLGLGGRTYFSAADEGFLSRLYRRPNPLAAANSPKCLAEGCDADLSNAKHYHRRHKVCEFHSKASTVVAAGLTQRFCQQCSRFHLLTEFDNGKRSCRRRLEDHNRRRRKSHRTTTTPSQDRRSVDIAGNSPSCSENPPRSPSESRAQSVSMEASPSVSSSSIFY